MFNRSVFNLQAFNLSNSQVYIPSFGSIVDLYTRYITPIVEIYFNEVPTVYQGTSVDSIKLLEELSKDSSDIFGTISSNELFITLDNSNKHLSSSNINGPYYGKIKPNTKIKAYLKFDFKDITFTEPLGTFFSGDWDDTSNYTVTSVRCFDLLYYISNKEIVGTKTIKNVSYGTLFEILFNLADLTSDEYVIDSSLYNTYILFGWLNNGTFKTNLQYLGQASNSFVYMSRDNKITVKALDILETPTRRITDNDQLVSIKLPTYYYNTYSKISVDILNPTKRQDEQILTMQSVTIPAGTSTITKASFLKKPVFNVSKIVLTNSNMSIINYKASVDNITIQLQNDTTEDLTDILVYGTIIEKPYTEKTVENTTIKDIIGEKLYKVSNDLIQSESYATQLINTLNVVASRPQSNVLIETRCDPRIVPGDILLVEDSTDEIPEQKILVYRHTIELSGGLSSIIEGYNIT